MLIRSTLLYMPAQIVGPLAQFVAAVTWTHYMGAAEYGLFALAVAAQELADAMCMHWWSHSTMRYIGDAKTPEQRARYASTETLALSGSLAIHAVVALAAVAFTSVAMTPVLAGAIIAYATTKTMTSYLSERARTEGMIGLYSFCQLTGPTFGLLFAWIAVSFVVEGAVSALLGYTLAQGVSMVVAAAVLGTGRMPAPPSWDIVKRAAKYGLPLVLAGFVSWFSINGIRLVVEKYGSLADVGLLSVGWALGLRLASVAGMLFAAAAFPLALAHLRAGRKDEAMNTLATNGAMLFGLLAPMSVGLFFIAEPVVTLLVAEDYRAATIAILPVAMLGAAVRNWRVHFVDHAYLLVERTGVLTGVAASDGLLVMIGCSIGFWQHGVVGAVWGAFAGVFVSTSIGVFIAMTRFSLRLPLKEMAGIIAASGAMAAALTMSPFTTLPAAIRIAGDVTIGAVVYATMSLLLHPELRGLVLRQIEKRRRRAQPSSETTHEATPQEGAPQEVTVMANAMATTEQNGMAARQEFAAPMVASKRPAPICTIAGQGINLADLGSAARVAAESAAEGRGFTLFTLNLDHLVKLRSDASFREAYRSATFVTADGAPVVWLGRKEAPQLERATGADLVDPLCGEAARRGVAVHFFGASPRTLERAKAELQRRHPGLIVAGMESPAMGFDPRSLAAEQAGDAIAATGAKICFVALGAPKQEFFADRMARRHPDMGFVCIGAALDFIAGEKSRAPGFFQRFGLEWVWRLGTEPTRLAGRYARCAGVFASLAFAAQIAALLGR